MNATVDMTPTWLLDERRESARHLGTPYGKAFDRLRRAALGVAGCQASTDARDHASADGELEAAALELAAWYPKEQP